jgi:hypothetical protein
VEEVRCGEGALIDVLFQKKRWIGREGMEAHAAIVAWGGKAPGA